MRRLKLLFLWICRSLGLFRVTLWLTRGRLRILCYHAFSAGDEVKFRPKLFITPERFEERLQVLKRYGVRVIPLDEAVEQLYSRTLPDYSVVITVDDGFHSFHSLAVPLLVRYQFPATVYVTTYYVRKGVPIFRLAVQYMFWKTKKELLILNDATWSRKACIDLTKPEEAQRAIWECIEFGERNCSENQRQEICAELGRLLEVPFSSIIASQSLHLMTERELQSLESSGVSVGLHTHRHTFPHDDRERAERELSENRRELAHVLGDVAPHFCYPSGLWRKNEWSWLEDSGIKSSTTCIPGLNGPATPRHALRRFLDGEDVHPLEFEAGLCGMLDILKIARSPLTSLAGNGRAAPETG